MRASNSVDLWSQYSVTRQPVSISIETARTSLPLRKTDLSLAILNEACSFSLSFDTATHGGFGKTIFAHRHRGKTAFFPSARVALRTHTLSLSVLRPVAMDVMGNLALDPSMEASLRLCLVKRPSPCWLNNCASESQRVSLGTPGSLPVVEECHSRCLQTPRSGSVYRRPTRWTPPVQPLKCEFSWTSVVASFLITLGCRCPVVHCFVTPGCWYPWSAMCA